MGIPVITASSTTRDQAITDLIQSVALEETALSHKHRSAAGLKLNKAPTSIQRACGIDFLWEGGQPCFVWPYLFFF